jgi:hypothetical protein
MFPSWDLDKILEREMKTFQRGIENKRDFTSSAF